MPVPADEVRVKEEPPELALLHEGTSHDSIREDILPRVSDIPTGRTVLGKTKIFFHKIIVFPFQFSKNHPMGLQKSLLSSCQNLFTKKNPT